MTKSDSAKPSVGVTDELTQDDLNRLCDLFELLDKWEREDRHSEAAGATQTASEPRRGRTLRRSY